jgi:hypothetical protein
MDALRFAMLPILPFLGFGADRLAVVTQSQAGIQIECQDE